MRCQACRKSQFITLGSMTNIHCADARYEEGNEVDEGA